MYYQNYKNHNKLKDVIKKYGCFFLSCVNMCELITGIELDKIEINDLWDFHKDVKDINENDDIINSENIINSCLFITGSKKKIREIATKQNGIINYYRSVSNEYRNKENEYYYIQKIITENDNTHFRIVDKNDVVIFDSFYPIPKIKKVLYTIVYTIK